MNFLSLQSTLQTLHPPISCFYKTIPKIPLLKPIAAIPARDRVVDFGKHKGKMLGTLPSTYLKWVSRNLRARDFEEWAKLADEVLEDQVYRDRIEWESAQKILNGDVLNSSLLLSSSSSSRIPQNAVSELLDISERFGWDNEDKLGWAKIDFGLLGTSKGGRIPRLLDSESRPNMDGTGYVKPKLGDNDNEGRTERRERLKMRRKSSIGNEEKSGIKFNDKGSFGILDKYKVEGNEKNDEEIMKSKSPFPGRESLIKKVLNRDN